MLNSLFFISYANSAILNAASCSQEAVRAAISSASNGDTINVPAGSCSWTSQIDINKQVSLIGAGIGKTNITTSASKALFIPTGTNNWRISGFSFTTSNSRIYAIAAGSSRYNTFKDWRIDNNKFEKYHYSVIIYGDSRGVIDHNVAHGGGFYILGSNNTAWTQDTNLGTQDFVFIEDNTFDTTNYIQNVLHVVYGGWGARYVIRYNEINETGGDRIDDAFDAHGYCHGSDIRGTRAFEIYGNTFTRSYAGCCRALFLRAGTGVIYNNVFDESGGIYYWKQPSAITFYEYRATPGGTGFASCSSECSTSALCATANGGEGWPCCDQIGTGKNQANEPVYIWGNVDHLGNAASIYSAVPDYIQSQDDYLTGHGTSPDYYDDGRTAPGYTAYTYPHPLVSGAPASKMTPPADFNLSQ